MKILTEVPSIKVTYDTNTKSQPIPSEDCSTYFDTYKYSIAYLPKGQIRLKASETNCHRLIYQSMMTTHNALKMQVFDSSILRN
ncbi:4249_t:CDS:2 [Diversispora eburnea]|uniref:4249_t:CDS:1 n=1 Tax=Diversispora eburnea TaxID=1213867 RepID=A0A9N9AZJ8_9GLOM|nr:4249_t:CDS:2 [Diversispora eburnea]